MTLAANWNNFDVRQTCPVVDAEAVSVGGGDQTLSPPCRAVYVGGDSNRACRLVGSTADVTFIGLKAGNVYPFAISIIRQSSTTITNSHICR